MNKYLVILHNDFIGEIQYKSVKAESPAEAVLQFEHQRGTYPQQLEEIKRAIINSTEQEIKHFYADMDAAIEVINVENEEYIWERYE